jgi:hypothetical protein
MSKSPGVFFVFNFCGVNTLEYPLARDNQLINVYTKCYFRPFLTISVNAFLA